MTDFQDMRARLRETRAAPAVSSEESGPKIPFGFVALGAVALGFVIVTLTPKLYSVQRTATLPAFSEVKPRVEEPAPAPAAAAVAPPVTADYAGRSPEEVAGLADAVCAQRVAAAKASPREAARVASDDGNGGVRIAAANERLHCFLSEGTARFCAASQRRKATADIINYFKGIEYANASVTAMRDAIARPMAPPGGDKAAAGNVELAPDPGVVEAIEGLLRAGYLAQGYRDDILTNVPRTYKDRFGRIVGSRVPCPERPWWQVWK